MLDHIVEGCKPQLVIAQDLKSVRNVLDWVNNQVKEHSKNMSTEMVTKINESWLDQNKAYASVIENTKDLTSQKILTLWFVINFLYAYKIIIKK